MGTDVKVLEVLLWGGTTSQPQLAQAASAAAEKPAQLCLWAGAEGPNDLVSCRGLLPTLCTLEEDGQV